MLEKNISKEEVLRRFADPKDQKKLVAKIGETYNKLAKLIAEDLRNADSVLERETFEAIRNFSLVSGAFAAFTIPLLAIHQSIFFALGISLHIVAVMVSVGFIFGVLDTRTKKLIRDSENLFDPVNEKSKRSLDVFKERLSFEDWFDDEWNKDFTQIHDDFTDKLQEMRDEKRKLDYTPDIAFVIFIIANSLILYGVLEWILVPVIADLLTPLFT